MDSSTTALSPPTGRASSTPEVPQIERVPWSILGPQFIAAWGYPRGKAQPEFIEIMGQTGSGKSFFEACILLQRQRARGSHIIVIATKPADSTMMELGWPIIDEYPPEDPREKCVIFWPQAAGLDREGQRQQAAAILKLLNRLWHPDSNVIIVFDEIAYLVNDLNFADIPLKTAITKYYREGRALGITLVATTQRPQGVIRQVHSESSWTVCFAPKDEEDAERMAQVLGGKRTYVPILKTLNREKYEFLIVHGLTGKMYISWIDHDLPRPPKKRDR